MCKICDRVEAVNVNGNSALFTLCAAYISELLYSKDFTEIYKEPNPSEFDRAIQCKNCNQIFFANVDFDLGYGGFRKEEDRNDEAVFYHQAPADDYSIEAIFYDNFGHSHKYVNPHSHIKRKNNNRKAI